jgi:hypothetical protein
MPNSCQIVTAVNSVFIVWLLTAIYFKLNSVLITLRALALAQ